MPEKTTTALTLLVQAAVPGGLAALLQLAMALAIGKIPKTAQLIGSILVAGLIGGGVSVLLVEVMHWSAVVSGTVAAMSGSIPAIRWATVANRVLEKQLKEKLGVDAEPPTETVKTEVISEPA